MSVSIKNGKLVTSASINLKVFHPKLDGLIFEVNEEYDPNFKADINLKNDGDMAKFYMGFFHETITKTIKLKASKKVTATEIGFDGFLNPQQLIVGGFMVGITRYTTSSIRYAKAKVDGVNGVILLPDNWSATLYSLNQPNKCRSEL